MNFNVGHAWDCCPPFKKGMISCYLCTRLGLSWFALPFWSFSCLALAALMQLSEASVKANKLNIYRPTGVSC